MKNGKFNSVWQKYADGKCTADEQMRIIWNRLSPRNMKRETERRYILQGISPFPAVISFDLLLLLFLLFLTIAN